MSAHHLEIIPWRSVRKHRKNDAGYYPHSTVEGVALHTKSVIKNNEENILASPWYTEHTTEEWITATRKQKSLRGLGSKHFITFKNLAENGDSGYRYYHRRFKKSSYKEMTANLLNINLLQQVLAVKYNKSLDNTVFFEYTDFLLCEPGVELPGLLLDLDTAGLYNTFPYNTVKAVYTPGTIVVGETPAETQWIVEDVHPWENIFESIRLAEASHDKVCSELRDDCPMQHYIVQRLKEDYKLEALYLQDKTHKHTPDLKHKISFVDENHQQREGVVFWEINPNTGRLELYYNITDNLYQDEQVIKPKPPVNVKELQDRIEAVKVEYGDLLADPLTPLLVPAVLTHECETTAKFLQQLITVQRLQDRGTYTADELEKQVRKLEKSWDKALAFAQARGTTIYSEDQQKVLEKAHKCLMLAQKSTSEQEQVAFRGKAVAFIRQVVSITPVVEQKILGSRKQIAST